MENDISSGYDTLPKFLLRNYQNYGDDRIAMRKKRFGIWNEYTWKDCYEKVKYFSIGLISLGFAHGETVAIIGDNDPEWFWAELAAIAAGGVVTGVFVDCLPPEVQYQVEHCDATIVLAKDQEQVDKMIEVVDKLPKVKKVIYWEPKGLSSYDHQILTSYDDVIQHGIQYEKSSPGLFEDNIAKGRIDDLALVLYTSGTKGLPKGAMMDHRYLLTLAQMNEDYCPVNIKDEYLSYILPGWLMEQSLGLLPWLTVGRTMSFPEDTSTAIENFREIAPSYVMQPSRQWEAISSDIQTKIEEANVIKRFFYSRFLPIGYRVAELRLNKKKIHRIWRVLYRIADFASFKPVRDRYGLTNVRTAVTAGAALSPALLKFFHAHGIPLTQAYGMTESGFVCMHTPDDVKSETVGKIHPKVKVSISTEGEILIGTDFIFRGYYKDPEKYTEMVRDGWLHTGDAGSIDDDGHLIYYDRLEDLMDIADGQKFAPQYIETRMKFSPRIQECIVIGGKGRPYISALINIAFDNVGRWAEKRRIPYTTYVDLSQKEQLANLIAKDIVKFNNVLPEEWRVKKFVLLHKEFDPDESEMTRTKKLRRTYMEESYSDLISAIYQDEGEYVIDAQVHYRDGKTAQMVTSLKIWSVDEVCR
ncbi:AMP-binding protein [Chloroflexota bacterium]